MGAISGTITTSAYYLLEDLPKDFRTAYVEAMTAKRFKDIDISSDQDESVGWCVTSDPFDTDFSIEKLHFTDYLMFSMRQDVLRLSPSVFKLHLAKRIADYKAEFDKDKVTKAEADNVRELLERELRRKVLPSIRIHDAVWNIQRGEVWLFTTNKRVNEIFQDLFTSTFGLTLAPRNAYARLERMKLPEAELARVPTLEPTVFAVGVPRRGMQEE